MRTGIAIERPSATITRPSDTNAYATGDLIANATSGASVVVSSFTNFSHVGSFFPSAILLSKTTTTLTNAQFRVHLFKAAPTITVGASAGDNGVFATNVAGAASWIGSYDGTMVAGCNDGAAVICTPTEGEIVGINLTNNPTVYALVEARAAYAPGNAEVFTLTLIAENN